jgi:hypothetical protein
MEEAHIKFYLTHLKEATAIQDKEMKENLTSDELLNTRCLPSKDPDLDITEDEMRNFIKGTPIFPYWECKVCKCGLRSEMVPSSYCSKGGLVYISPTTQGPRHCQYEMSH